MLKKVLLLLQGDIRSTIREPVLIMSVIAPLIITAVLRYILPLLNRMVDNFSGFLISDHYYFIVSFFISLTPMLIGNLIGFIILDDKDQDLLTYYAVTPLGRTSYLLYRLFVPVLVSFLFSFIVLYFSGLIEVDFFKHIPTLLLAALGAPLSAFFLGIFAGNKVEGLALAKAMGIFYLAPLAGYLIKSPWQFLGSFAPPYWISKTFLSASLSTLSYWVNFLIGVAVHLIYLYLMIKKFNRMNP